MSPNTQQSDIIQLRPILLKWWNARWWFALSVTVCFIAAFLFCKIRTEKYEIHASLLIEDEDKSSLNEISISDLLGNKGNVNDERFIIASHALMRETARQLGLERTHLVARDWTGKRHLYRDYPLDVVADEGIADTLRQSLEFKINVTKAGEVKVKSYLNGDKVSTTTADSLPITVKTPCANFKIFATPDYRKGKPVSSTIIYEGYDAVAEDLMEDISIEPASKKTNVIKISMPTHDIDYARDIINTLVNRYNIRSISRRNEEGNRTIKFIDSRLKLLTGDLAETEAEAESFKKNRNIADIAGEAEYQTLKKGKTEHALIEANTETEILKMALDFLSQPQNAYQLLPASFENKALQEAIDQYNKLILKHINLEKTARPGNRQLEMLSEQIDALRANITSSVSRAYQSSMVAVNQLKSEYESAQSKLGEIPSQERGFRDISRRQMVKEKLYLFLLQNREQTAMMLANATPKGIVIDEAFALKEPLTMKKRYIYLIALVIGLMIPPVVIAIKSLLRNKFSTLDELRSLTTLPILGEISLTRSTSPIAVYQGAQSSAAELFRQIRSHLQFIIQPKRGNVILITSTSSGEGKSFISVNLAATLALSGKKVMVVGADVRKPRLATYLSITEHRPGLTAYLANNHLTPADLIIPADDSRLFDVILSGAIPPNPAELLLSNRLDKLFEYLAGIYDYILIDSAPVGMVSDTFTLDRIAQATIYVLRANKTTFDDINFANSLADEKRLTNIALVLNGTISKKGYGYGYSED
ncbi:MAG: polysaccharide biosynthesis tyrosine autokinase [Muribaculaceae bacterium]|nr:polysaccharide biosynthesis tyrosine autokinase [Muribaculaceae bacterium]